MIKSKILNPKNMMTLYWSFRTIRLCILLLTAVSISSCDTSDPYDTDDESGIIGTGVILEPTGIELDGTVNDTLLASGSSVDVISSDGGLSKIAIRADRQFSTSSLYGAGPWLLRVQVNTDRELFGIAYGDGTRNINSFSDVSLRRWFAQQSLSINNIFDTAERVFAVPTSSEYDESVSSIVSLIDLVLKSYDVDETDIISRNYSTNDEGVDAFLRRNTALVENDLITFQITDPVTNIQAETGSPVELNGNSIDSGTAPTRPSSVRALSGGMNDIVLIWEPSSDDISVVGYVVLRDGEILGTTAFPQYVDEGLVSSERYSYVILALDGAGNSSAPSISVTGTSSPTASTNPPPMPTQLSEISGTSSSIRLSWLQENGLNVASYNVYKGLNRSALGLVQRVSVTRATDSAVVADDTYCYQVSAVNVLGIESSRTDVLCIDAQSVDAAATTPTPVPSEQPVSELVGEWAIPNVDTVVCNNVLVAADIPLGLTTITSGCYTVPQSLNVAAGATLQLGEGVILKFDEEVKLSVEGTLTVLGTKDNPVVFTGTSSLPGHWAGIEIAGSKSSGNLLRGAVVQYGGNGDIKAAVSGVFDGVRLSIEDTLVRYNSGYALSFNTNGARIDSFEGNLFLENADVGNVVASTVENLAGNSRYIDNTVNELTVVGSDFEGDDITIPYVGIPISLGDLSIVSGSLTIAPGADIEVLGSSLIEVDGPVNIIGTAERPITLRGRGATQGYWEGVRLYGQGDKVLNHVNISFGGANAVDTGAIEIDCLANNSFRVQIDNTDITGSASWGIYSKGSECITAIGNTVTFSNNALGNTNAP